MPSRPWRTSVSTCRRRGSAPGRCTCALNCATVCIGYSVGAALVALHPSSPPRLSPPLTSPCRRADPVADVHLPRSPGDAAAAADRRAPARLRGQRRVRVHPPCRRLQRLLRDQLGASVPARVPVFLPARCATAVCSVLLTHKSSASSIRIFFSAVCLFFAAHARALRVCYPHGARPMQLLPDNAAI